MTLPSLRQRAALAAIALAALPAFAASTVSNTPVGTSHTSQKEDAAASTSKDNDGWTEAPKVVPAKPKASPELIALGQEIAQPLSESGALKLEVAKLTEKLDALKEDAAQVFDRLSWWDKLMSGGNPEMASLNRQIAALKNKIAEKNQLAATRDKSATDRTGGYLERTSQLYRNYQRAEDGLRPVLRQTKATQKTLKDVLSDLESARSALSTSTMMGQNQATDDKMQAQMWNNTRTQVEIALNNARNAMSQVQNLNGTFADFKRTNRVFANSNSVQTSVFSPFTPVLADSMPVLGNIELNNATTALGTAIGTLQATQAQVQAAGAAIEKENSGYVQRRTALINSTMKSAVKAASDAE